LQKSNNDITQNMRKILIDWMIEVHFNFKHLESTVNLSIYVLDIASNMIKGINRKNYQLLGTVCCKIADVYNENSRE
jgi:hypothetical protein